MVQFIFTYLNQLLRGRRQTEASFVKDTCKDWFARRCKKVMVQIDGENSSFSLLNCWPLFGVGALTLENDFVEF